ncbi:MAG: hypothetical protein EAX86_03405 [Candidatus Heimdallarchaeota archaeon]|nr:hypothetical protein [Candidatus Heimdallarchaeota archaeon]
MGTMYYRSEINEYNVNSLRSYIKPVNSQIECQLKNYPIKISTSKILFSVPPEIKKGNEN